jgi:hypothetical protein
MEGEARHPIMAETSQPPEDHGLNPADRPRALGLIFKRYGRKTVRPTVPTRVTIYRDRTGVVETWEVIAWVPRRQEYIAWRRDTNVDHHLKAKEFPADDDLRLEGHHIPRTDRWTDEPIDEEVEPIRMGAANRDDLNDETFLQVLDLGLTDPNSIDLARLGNEPPEPPEEP